MQKFSPWDETMKLFDSIQQKAVLQGEDTVEKL